jgi:hypothetical protein
MKGFVACRCFHSPPVLSPHRDSFRIGTVAGVTVRWVRGLEGCNGCFDSIVCAPVLALNSAEAAIARITVLPLPGSIPKG